MKTLSAFVLAMAGLVLPIAVAPALAVDNPRPVILVVETSDATQGQAMLDIRSGVSRFLAAIPASVRVGLVTFGNKPQLAAGVSSSRSDVNAALKAARPAGGAALRDAIEFALLTFGNARRGNIVVINATADRRSGMTQADLLANIRLSTHTVDAIGFGLNSQQAAVLAEYTSASNGSVFLASGSGQVEAPLLKIAAALQVQAADPSASASPGLPAPTQPALIDDAEANRVVMPRVLASLFALSLLGLLVGLISVMSDAYSVQRVRKYVGEYSEVLQRNAGRGRLKLDGRILDEQLAARFHKTVDRLEAAEIRIGITRWLQWLSGATLLTFVLLQLLTGALWVSLPIATVLAWQGPKLVIRMRIARRRKEFADELPTVLSLIASSLRAGLTMPQAIDTAVADGEGEMARQMRRALNEVKVGSTIEVALMGVADRMESEDLKWVVTALAIQREVGGGLAKVLDTASATVRGRAELRREVKTLTAEGRLSAYVLAALPIGILLTLTIAQPDYVSVFWTSIIGYVMLVMMLVAFAVGGFWVSRLIRIKV